MVRRGARRAATIATTLVLGAGLAACGESDDKKGSAGAQASAPDPQRAAYLDQFVAFLRTTAQGAHVQGAEYRTEKRHLNIDVDTDLPELSPAMDQLSYEAGQWATDHPEVRIDLVFLFTAGRADFTVGNVPGDNPLQKAANVSTAELLAVLKATPQGPHIVRLGGQVMFEEVQITIRIDRKAYELGSDDPETEETKAIMEGLAESVRTWVREHPDRKVTSVFIMDIDAVGMTSYPVGTSDGVWHDHGRRGPNG